MKLYVPPVRVDIPLLLLTLDGNVMCIMYKRKQRKGVNGEKTSAKRFVYDSLWNQTQNHIYGPTVNKSQRHPSRQILFSSLFSIPVNCINCSIHHLPAGILGEGVPFSQVTQACPEPVLACQPSPGADQVRFAE